MIIGIEFNTTTINTDKGCKTFVRVAPYLDGMQPKNQFAVKAIALGVGLFTAVVFIGKAFAV